MGKPTKRKAQPTQEDVANKEVQMRDASSTIDSVLKQLSSKAGYTGLGGYIDKLKLAKTKLDGALARKDPDEMFGKPVQEAIVTAIQAKTDYPELPAADREGDTDMVGDEDQEAAAAPAAEREADTAMSAEEVADDGVTEQEAAAVANVLGLFEPEPVQTQGDGAAVPPPSQLKRDGDADAAAGQEQEVEEDSDSDEEATTTDATEDAVEGDNAGEVPATTETVGADIGDNAATAQGTAEADALHQVRLDAAAPSAVPAAGRGWGGTVLNIAGAAAGGVAAVLLAPEALALAAGAAGLVVGGATMKWWFGPAAPAPTEDTPATPADDDLQVTATTDVVPSVEDAAAAAEQALAGRGRSATFDGDIQS